MITLHIFTEEPSIENVFRQLLPKIIPQNTYFQIYPHQGKQDLEKALSKTLPSISKIPGSKILIVRDQDSDLCTNVKQNIRKIVEGKCYCDYFIRIVCKELESWFLGDVEAIHRAYKRFNPDLYKNKAIFREVDSITNPNVLLRDIIPEFEKYASLPKLEVSSKIAEFMDIDNNTSISFKNTILAIKKLTVI